MKRDFGLGGLVYSALLIFNVASAPSLAKVIYVKADATGAGNGTSWKDAYTELRVGLPNALFGDEIWVAEGTYKPASPGVRSGSFYLKSGVAIYGGFGGTESELDERDWEAHPTILSGDLLGNDTDPFGNYGDNSYHVVRGIDVDDLARLDGFTIVGGNATGVGSDFSAAGLSFTSVSATVANCVVTKNLARNGAGLGVGVVGSPTFINCNFEMNQATEYAGAVNDVTTSGRVSFYACSFLGNTAGKDGGVATTTFDGSLVMVNCLMSGNSAVLEGGAVHLEYKDAEFIHCTFVQNQSGTAGGGVYVGLYGASASFQNCVLWGNEDASGAGESAQVDFESSSSPLTIEYSAVQGWTGQLGGVGVIDDNPNFVDPDGLDNVIGTADDDPRLKRDSPCIDAGSNDHSATDDDDLDGDGDTLELLLTDRDGFGRFEDDPFSDDTGDGPAPIVDMGAFEYRDCNANTIDDYHEIVYGGAEDCANDGIIDTCEPDCNGNGTADSCDILNRIADDCDADGVPDACELDAGLESDCNGNSIPDSCDIETGGSGDCNANGIPDECYWQGGESTDCDANGTPDECDPDCNRNIRADACDISEGTSLDCDSNGVPDECQVDCDANGIPDSCDVAQENGADENGDGYLDECQIIFVNASASGEETGLSWMDAYTDLQDALHDLPYRDPPVVEIWVAAGTYHPTGYGGSLNVSFEFPDSVDVYGGFAGWESDREERDWLTNPTVLSGDLKDDDDPDGENTADNSFGIATVDGTPTIDGFTFTAGHGGTNAGAALNVIYSSPTIRHCRFVGNEAGTGGAVYIYVGSPTFEDCEFMDNRATSYDGGAVYCGQLGYYTDYAEPLFIDCRFMNNIAERDGGGFRMVCEQDEDGKCAQLINCSFIGNSAGESGGALSHSWAYYAGGTLVNCLFSGNTAGFLGGAVHTESDQNIHNCTFVGNSAGSGGALYATAAKVTTKVHTYNSLIWGNSDSSGMGEDAQFGYDDPDYLDLNYCTLQGWTGVPGGVANNGVDPVFVDADGPDDAFGTEDDNARLTFDSPAIDSGSNALAAADAFDLDGDGDAEEPIPYDLDGLTRFVEVPAIEDGGEGTPPIVDRGAYEFQRSCEGDQNGDWTVDPLDSGYVLSRFGCAVGRGDPLCDAADANLDGIVDPLDVGYVLSRLGQCL